MRTNVGILDFLSAISIQDLTKEKLLPGEANFFTSLDGRVAMYGNRLCTVNCHLIYMSVMYSNPNRNESSRFSYSTHISIPLEPIMPIALAIIILAVLTSNITWKSKFSSCHKRAIRKITYFGGFSRHKVGKINSKKTWKSVAIEQILKVRGIFQTSRQWIESESIKHFE